MAQAKIPDFISFPLALHSPQEVFWCSLHNKCRMEDLTVSSTTASVQATSIWPSLLQKLLTGLPDSTLPRVAY